MVKNHTSISTWSTACLADISRYSLYYQPWYPTAIERESTLPLPVLAFLLPSLWDWITAWGIANIIPLAAMFLQNVGTVKEC